MIGRITDGNHLVAEWIFIPNTDWDNKQSRPDCLSGILFAPFKFDWYLLLILYLGYTIRFDKRKPPI
jgi:hypothetical protein